jgi:hypothetical protein
VFVGDVGLELVLAVFVTREDRFEIGGGHALTMSLIVSFFEEGEVGELFGVVVVAGFVAERVVMGRAGFCGYGWWCLGHDL